MNLDADMLAAAAYDLWVANGICSLNKVLAVDADVVHGNVHMALRASGPGFRSRYRDLDAINAGISKVVSNY